MTEKLNQYSEETRRLAEQRAGEGILLMTARGRILLIDSRATELCQQIRVAAGERGGTGTLPLPIVKIVNEIADSLDSRSHLKDSEAFSLRRVIEGHHGSIMVAGIGLPAGSHATERRILLTLDTSIPRTSMRRVDAFHLSPREASTVEGLLKGSTNKEIARAMGITEQTAKEHIKHIMEKTKTSTRTGVIMAIAGPRELVTPQSITEPLPKSTPRRRRSNVPISYTHA